mmetsp:Transcript_14295/g.18060  ORF Transcript_14295/g.18060 Transcript_14295/m.18060 type:complete len:220 (+) Transcript_14295:63-722(+)
MNMKSFFRLVILLFHVAFVSSSNKGFHYNYNHHGHGLVNKLIHSSTTSNTSASTATDNSRFLADISRRCKEELVALQKSNEFQVEFPQLTQEEFQQHCKSSVEGISCDLENTHLIEQYKSICEDGAGGSTVRINMAADGGCVGNVKVEFWNFPVCTGRSCDAVRFVDSYREKLHTETDFIVGDCKVELSLASTSSGSRIVLANVFVVTLVGTAVAILSL